MGPRGHAGSPQARERADIRNERDAKEHYYDPYVDQRGLRSAPYGGRAILAEEAARRYERLRQLCPEDIGALHDAIAKVIG